MKKESVMLVETPEWEALATHYRKTRNTTLRTLFRKDAGRGEKMRAEAAGLMLDYSKNRVTDETMSLLRALAKARGLKQGIKSIAIVAPPEGRMRILPAYLTGIALIGEHFLKIPVDLRLEKSGITAAFLPELISGQRTEMHLRTI